MARLWAPLARLYRDNVHDMDGQVLPHLVLSEYVDWMGHNVQDDHESCAEMWDWLGRCYDEMDDDVRNLICVSGVEMLPDPSEPAGRLLRALLPTNLRALDPWPPTG